MVLPPPAAHGGYHLFLSHCWQHGQDQCATLKERLRQMLSGFSIFLDVDDLTDIALLEEYIASSDVLLVFLTRDYISSKNCRRELVAAMHQDLPIVVLRESEYGKGAVTSGGLQLEFEQLLPTLSTDEVNSIRRLWKFIAPAPGCGTAGRWAGVASLGVIDWHRENHFKLSALKAVGEAYNPNPNTNTNPNPNPNPPPDPAPNPNQGRGRGGVRHERTARRRQQPQPEAAPGCASACHAV